MPDTAKIIRALRTIYWVIIAVMMFCAHKAQDPDGWTVAAFLLLLPTAWITYEVRDLRAKEEEKS